MIINHVDVGRERERERERAVETTLEMLLSDS